MSSVTNRIKEIKQPRGGYISPKIFTVVQLEDKQELFENENISPSTVGTVVDYLTRYKMTENVEDAFKISLGGALRASLMTKGNQNKIAESFVKEIKGLDDNSIIYACKLVFFDVWLRNPMAALLSSTSYDDINPDTNTISNIRMMVERSLKFWEGFGPVMADGFTFGPNGYTDLVDSGDGDYLTKDTMWDFKVSKNEILSKYILQLLMYWIMGKHSGNEIFDNISKIGFYNPRLNKVYVLDMATVSEDIIKTVEKEVIGY